MTRGVDQAGPAGDLGRRGVGLLSGTGERLLRTWRRIVATWQRSIQLRVVTATLALSVVVVLLWG